MTQERYWNTDAWHFNDKEWLTARKQEWKHVQKNLKIIASTEFRDSNYLKAHKEFFLKARCLILSFIALEVMNSDLYFHFFYCGTTLISRLKNSMN